MQTSERHLRHYGTTRTMSYDMNAAFMLLQLHGWDIHAVRTRRRARKASHGSAPGHASTTGHSQADTTRSMTNLSQAALG